MRVLRCCLVGLANHGTITIPRSNIWMRLPGWCLQFYPEGVQLDRSKVATLQLQAGLPGLLRKNEPTIMFQQAVRLDHCRCADAMLLQGKVHRC